MVRSPKRNLEHPSARQCGRVPSLRQAGRPRAMVRCVREAHTYDMRKRVREPYRLQCVQQRLAILGLELQQGQRAQLSKATQARQERAEGLAMNMNSIVAQGAQLLGTGVGGVSAAAASG